MKAHPELRAALDELLKKLDQTIDPAFQDKIHLSVLNENNSDVSAPVGHVAETLEGLDKTHYSYLSK